MYYVYKITNKKDGKYYVGRTSDLEKRVKRHFRELEKGIHHNVNMQNSFTSKDDYEITHTIVNTLEEALEKEQSYLTSDNNEMYNINLSSTFGDALSIHPNREIIVGNIKNAVIKRYEEMSPEEKKRVYGQPGKRNGMFGKSHTKEVRERLSQFNKGNSYSKGRVMSTEQRQQLSDLASQRTGDKNPFYGKQHSEETRKLISEKNKGRKPTNMKAVCIGSEEYESLSEAGRQLGVHGGTILYRIKSKNYPEYRYK